MSDNKQLDRIEIAKIVDPEAKLHDLEGVIWSKFTLQQRALAFEKADRIIAYMLASCASKIKYCGECDLPSMTYRAIMND